MRTDSHESAISTSEALTRAFAAFAPDWSRWMRSSSRESGLTPARIRLLALLADREPTTMTQVSRLLGVSPRNITTLVDALESEGLVSRVPHPTDRRATNIMLTPRGQSLVANLGDSHVRSAATLFDVLTERERANLLTLMGKLQAELRSRGLES